MSNKTYKITIECSDGNTETLNNIPQFFLTTEDKESIREIADYGDPLLAYISKRTDYYFKRNTFKKEKGKTCEEFLNDFMKEDK